MFFSQVRKSDSAVVGVQNSPSPIPSSTDFNYVEITQKEYNDISREGFFYEGSVDRTPPPHKWEETTPNVITLVEDTRPILVLSVDDLTPTTTQEITISVQAKDYQGNDLDLTTSRKVAIYLSNSLWKVKNLPVVNGFNTFQRTFSQSGIYLILPYGSGFRISGDNQFTVTEEF